jgi:hypothetical protein
MKSHIKLNGGNPGAYACSLDFGEVIAKLRDVDFDL